MKMCNIVVYNVGYGGNIIRFLLSLHPNTFLLAPKGDVDITKPRHEIYSFKNLQWKYGTWANYERSQDWGKISTSEWISSFLAQDKYDTLTVADHPDEITDHQQLKQFDKINYLTVGISKKYDDQIYSFLRSNDANIENYFKHGNKSIEKFNKIFVSHNPIKNIERNKILKVIYKNELFVYHRYSGHKELIKSISKYKFVACPSGNKIDTVLIWESLFLNAIPILIKSNFTQNLKIVFFREGHFYH